MRQWQFRLTALGALLVVVMAVAAQEPGKGQDDEPQRKGMMMRGMMGQGMPMPMMMEMHRQHAALESQWEATADGVFVLRPDQLLKYDTDLTLVKSVDLPGQPMPMMPPPGEGGERGQGKPKMKMGMENMQQMMAMMHGSLPARLSLTPDAVFVSRGSRLLKFSRDLELQKTVDLPDVKPMMCPMCAQMMSNRREMMKGGRQQ